MKWVGRILLVLLLLLAIGAAIQLIRWAQAREDDPNATFIFPRMEVARLSIERLDPEATTATIEMSIDQPAPVGFTLDSLEYVLTIAGKEVMRSTYAHRISVGANDSAHITLPITLRTRKLLDLLKALEAEGRDSVEYAMDARFHLPAAFWRDKPIEVRMARTLPLFRIPRVDMRDPAIDKFGFGESRISIDLAVFNPNVFDLAFSDFALTAQLEEHEVVLTSVDPVVRIPAHDTAVIHLPMRIAPGHMIEGVFDLLVKPARTPYSYRMELTLVSDQASLDNCHLVVVGDGKLEDLKALRKKK